jgi:hypothetical protein
MLAELACAVSMTKPTEARLLPIRFCLVRLAVGLPHQLYGFHLMDIDDSGRTQLPEVESEVCYAVVANHSQQLIRESAVTFLLDLIGRVAPIRDVMAERLGIDELPGRIAEADAASGLAAWETLSYDWTRAAEVIRERAASAGLRLDVRFESDPFPHASDLARRIPALRRLYREEARVRRWVDHAVAAVTSGDWELRGGFEPARQFAQQQTTTVGLQHYLAQAMRDAFVCGNGYFQPGMSGLDMAVRCLHPHRVSVAADGAITEDRTDGDRLAAPGTVHLRGVEQIGSPYGFAAIEPLLYIAEQRRVAVAAKNFARGVPPKERASLGDRLDRSIASSDAMLTNLEARLLEITGSIETLPREVPDDLYLPGRELG